jgi:hypothetical protein
VITYFELKDMLEYDPFTGVFRWRKQVGQRGKPGNPAGSVNGEGYIKLQVKGKPYQAHRLAWFFMTGQWPRNQIDHINGARADNRFKNLRDVTRTVNLQNLQGPRSDNTVGFMGVTRNGRGFSARIKANGAYVRLGTHPTPEQAHAAYIEAKRKLHEGNQL